MDKVPILPQSMEETDTEVLTYLVVSAMRVY